MLTAGKVVLPPWLLLSLVIPGAIIVGYPILKVLYTSFIFWAVASFTISFLIYGREDAQEEE